MQYTFFTGDVKKKWKSSLRQQQIIFENNSNHYNLETAFPDEFTDHYMFEVRRIREILWKVNTKFTQKRLLVLEINFTSIFPPRILPANPRMVATKIETSNL